MDGPSSGTGLLDRLIDDVRIGDNLVLLADEHAPLELLVSRFVAHASGRQPIVLVNVAAPFRGDPPVGTTVLEWSAIGSRRPLARAGALPPQAVLTDALASLRAADEAVGVGAAFVFDDLEAVQAAWGKDTALELFVAACPRLYRRRSLALWPLRAAAHPPAFLRRLTEVTQVVVELTSGDDHVQLVVRKADGRDDGVVGRSVQARVVAGDLRAAAPLSSTRERVGTVIREQRLARGISQAELARRVGVTASALSQVERGVRGPSGDTLVRLWEVLGVPFGPVDDGDPGYRVARRGARHHTRLQEGMEGERLTAGAATGEVWILQLDPGASGDRAPFAVKSAETIAVLRGIVDLQLAGRSETLQEGDAVVVDRAAVSGWANPGGVAAELLWIVHGG